MADEEKTTGTEAAETAKPEPETAKPETAKPEAAKPEAAKPEPAEAAKQEAVAAGEQQAPAEGAPPQEGESAEQAPKPEAKPARGRSTRVVSTGVVHIKATFNNTMVSITDSQGGVVAWSSAGRAGFKGSRKSTAFAATIVGQEAARQAIGRGMREVEVRVQGAGAGRESAVRAIQSAGLSVSVIKDVTPIPHNGCRARKRRRV